MQLLTAADGHRFEAYSAGDETAALGLVVIQEAFGLNDHIRDVCDRLAREGFRVVAPALFDRVERGVRLGYGEADLACGLKLRDSIGEADILRDVEASADSLERPSVGVLGFCWGGTVAWLSSTRLRRFSAAVGWYGSGIAALAHEPTYCPVQLHFAELDRHIPPEMVDGIRRLRPEVELFVYPGVHHGFGCPDRPEVFDRGAQALAWDRTLAFFRRHVAAGPRNKNRE